jgi:hypothetical protein
MSIFPARTDEIPASRHVTSTTTPGEHTRPCVYFTIFTGRKRYLSILVNYLDRLLAMDVVTEVHLWDYARTTEDSHYINELASRDDRYVLMKPTRNMHAWSEYYAFYAQASYAADDVVIKCDDDVVYIDVERMQLFLDHVAPNGLYYPNIVNNDVCAYMQTHYQVHALFPESDVYAHYNRDTVPLSDWHNGWYTRHDRASAIHTQFLQNPESFLINAPPFPWSGRISINCFAGRFACIQVAYEQLNATCSSDDEAFLSWDLFQTRTSAPELKSYIVPFMRVVHFAFNLQGVAELDRLFLPGYIALADRPNG